VSRAPLNNALERMRRILTPFAIWLGLLLATVIATDLIAVFTVDANPETGMPRQLSTVVYSIRFAVEAVVYSLIGVLCGRYVRATPQAGLFALSLGLAYVAYRELTSGLWYYLTAHPSRVDQFFFAAPVLAPVLFLTGTCLIYHAFIQRSSRYAL